MDINIDSKQLDGEMKELESSVDQIYFHNRVEMPSQDIIKGCALEAYMQEYSKIVEVMALYQSLLLDDIAFVKSKAAEVEKADSDYATQVKSNS
ncbi:MAG: hypothetical protein E7257_03550 [Lachnospiraceae bacterium]|nr:hypothetical protein [Lachnospiraceae bacterium]